MGRKKRNRPIFLLASDLLLSLPTGARYARRSRILLFMLNQLSSYGLLYLVVFSEHTSAY
jgi:hypothetical protein